MKLNSSRKVTAVLFAMILLLMLVCNFLTTFVADDFAYIASYATGERIDSVLDIFPSMAGHAKSMNGRLISHFFVQLFMMLPKWIFNIANSVVFTLQIFLLYILSLSGNRERKCNNLLALVAFGAIWVYVPAFGQVYLWLAGSCNYMWAITAGLVFMIPFVREFMDGARINNPVLKCLFVLFGFVAGAYSENASAAFIFMAGILWLFTVISRRRMPSVDSVLSIVFAIAGYLSMMLAPGTQKNKSTDFDLQHIRSNFVNCFEVLRMFYVLLIVFVILLVIACVRKVDRKTVVLSCVFAAGSLLSNFILMFASYYPERSSTCCVVLLVGACTILMHPLTDSNYKVFIGSLVAVLLVITSYYMVIGVNDIYVNYCNMRGHINTIKQCKEEGKMDVELVVFSVNTKYSSSWKLKYLDMDTSDTWPNNYMASYYGVKSIIGVWE